MSSFIHAHTVLCILALVILAIAVSVQHDTDMRYRLLQQQHQPILSGSLFPDPNTAESKVTLTTYPSVCKDHGSGHFFAVTSLGEGFPRVQYTCSRQQPTCSSSRDRNSGRNLPGVDPPKDVHNPAEPIPEHTPSPIRQLLCDVTGCHSTPDHTTISSPVVCEHGYRPQYGFLYNPKEQPIAVEPHTTTATYSKNEHLQVRPIPSSNQAEMRSREQELHSGRFKTMPEPMVPTSTSTSSKAKEHLLSSSLQEPLPGKKQKAGPPQPMPEPTPGQVNTVHAGGKPPAVLHASDRLTVRHYNHETKRGLGVKTVVHRITTIIMETETYITRPSPTSNIRMHHPKQPRLGDHVMFDAGEEGDLIVSIVSNEHTSQAKGQRSGKGKDKGMDGRP